MRRRVTPRDGSSDRELAPSLQTKNKRREISSLDRAATERIAGSLERGRSHGRHTSDRDHCASNEDHTGRNRRHVKMKDSEDLLAQRPKHRDDKNIQSAKTFRRGRILVFLNQLEVKRSTLVQQLQQPEFKSIEQVISGELKAVDEIIQQFTHLFELREIESDDPTKS